MNTKRILVVDDDNAIREFVEMALHDEGYEVAVAEHGLDALDRLHGKAVDLILLDMRMPVMDGWAFLNVYHDLPSPHVPVIAVSANARSLAATTEDVVAFLAKPYDLEELIDLIERYLKHPTIR
jgi:two-component system, chemotaxis family, chemotaxis protein CheY